jgi:hypothetical protein
MMWHSVVHRVSALSVCQAHEAVFDPQKNKQ